MRTIGPSRAATPTSSRFSRREAARPRARATSSKTRSNTSSSNSTRSSINPSRQPVVVLVVLAVLVTDVLAAAAVFDSVFLLPPSSRDRLLCILLLLRALCSGDGRARRGTPPSSRRRRRCGEPVPTVSRSSCSWRTAGAVCPSVVSSSGIKCSAPSSGRRAASSPRLPPRLVVSCSERASDATDQPASALWSGRSRSGPLPESRGVVVVLWCVSSFSAWRMSTRLAPVLVVKVCLDRRTAGRPPPRTRPA
mmetsp:Transcript_23890/g.94745  ORF Transcript_23890/g.94745 Transcript_23890/m.94745 type:complete len:251 (+) Transcript_23890:1642-2394(+)